MRRGEVWWVERPNVGRRPHLIFTRQAAIPVLNAVTAVPTTRTARNIPSEVTVTPEDGMPTEWVLSLDNLTRIPKAFFVERICQLSGARMNEVCAALAYATDCD